MKSYGLRPVIEKDEAVSPIIATILLVAITVILASTLYLALGGFFKSGTSATPTAALQVSAPTTDNYTLAVGAVSSNTISLTQVEIEYFIAGQGYFSQALSSTSTWVKLAGGPSTITLSIEITANPGSTDLASGLQITIGPSSVGGTSTAITGFELYYTGSPAGSMESGAVSPS